MANNVPHILIFFTRFVTNKLEIQVKQREENMFRDMAGIAQAARGRLEQNGDTEPRYQVGDRVVHLYTGKTTTVTRVVHKYNMYQLDGLPEDSVVGANDIRHHDV